jgi:uncharacterized membrane protein
MRVTKIIREYVEKTVNAKIPYGEPTQTYKQHQQALTDLRTQLEEKVDAYAQELLASVGNLPEGFTITRTNYCIFNSSTYKSPMYDADQAHQYQVREKRREAIENILLELELGATKADLERLISEAIGE